MKNKWVQQLDAERLLLSVIIVAATVLAAIALSTDWGLYRGDKDSSTLYLLSAIVQALATILALLITFSLIATQLASASYSSRAVRQRLKDFWFWFAVGIYIAAIVSCVAVLSGWDSLLPAWEKRLTNLALVLAAAALACLVPFTLATLKSLAPERMARSLIKQDDYAALDDLMRRAVNDGLLAVLTSTIEMLADRAKKQLGVSKDLQRVAKADEMADVLLSIGRHACQRHSPDGVILVMRHFAGLATYCNEHRRLWRGAADVFNEAAKKLYFYSEEWIAKDAAMNRSGQDFARISVEAGNSFHAIAQVKAQGREANLKLAIDAYMRALSFYLIDKFPRDYATTQNNLGAAYGDLAGVRDKEANLGRAVAAYQEALKVCTLDGFPVQYAMTQNNLGNAYQGLAEVRDKEANLGRAVAAYQEALNVRTLDGFPVDYATTQNNLGNAYRGLAEVRDKEANLGRAVAAYQEALKVRTLDGFPVQYAMTQNNLGNAYRGLAEVRDKEANLGRAVAAYAEALKVYERENMTDAAASVRKNLEVLRRASGSSE